MDRLEGAGWQIDHIKLRLVTASKGIAGNGLPPRNGWQSRVRHNGTHVGYVPDQWDTERKLWVPDMEALMTIMGDDIYALGVRDGKARKAA